MTLIPPSGVEPQPDRHERWSRIPRELRRLPQWALSGPDKSPRTVDGSRASSTDPGTWTDFDTATQAAAVRGWEVGFMLHEADPYCCVDLDVKLDTPAEHIARFHSIVATLDSFAERSRSGRGWHIWVKASTGRGRKRDGVEVYSRERFIICTGDVFYARPIEARQELLDNMVSRMDPPAPEFQLWGDPCPDYALATRAAAAAGELGRLWAGNWQGRYPSQSEADLALVKLLAPHTDSPAECWATFRLSRLGEREKASRPDYARSTLARAAQIAGEDAAHVRAGAEIAQALLAPDGPVAPNPVAKSLTEPTPTFTLEFAMSTDTATLALEYLADPWLPRGCVVGFFGRGSTAKSSFLATLAAKVSGSASTLWVSVEEPADWIKVRHIASGGAHRTLAVVRAVESKRDRHGHVVASSFNVHEHLEPAIVQAKQEFARDNRPPLRLVVLDTAVGLTTWGKGESPNDDAAVKKLLAHLQAWAERHDLTIAIIGHANKGTHDHLADTVMGATAWTNSPRLSFVHAEDRREDHAYVVRVAKSNLVTFGAPYRTEPVHTLRHREDGPDSVLVKVVPGEIVWGSHDSMEMFKEATKKPKEDDGQDWGAGAPLSPPSLPEQVAHTLVEMALALDSPQQFVTREQVEQRVGKKVDRSRWVKVEQYLANHPQVIATRGERNMAEYRRRL